MIKTHTPGPWFIGSWSGQCFLEHEHGGKNCRYEYRLDTSIPEYKRVVSCGDEHKPMEIIGWNDYGTVLKNTSDANLIAAAPEMLAALKKHLAYMACDAKDWGEYFLEVSNLIDKAEGNQDH